jgi:hypothetical protein
VIEHKRAVAVNVLLVTDAVLAVAQEMQEPACGLRCSAFAEHDAEMMLKATSTCRAEENRRGRYF